MFTIDQKAISKKESITVEFFHQNTRNKFRLKLISNESGFNRKIYEQNLHRPGLAIAGFVDLFSYSRVQIFGNTEIQYLIHLPPEKQIEALERIFQFDIPCIILTNDNKPIDGMLDLANKYKIPVFFFSLHNNKINLLCNRFSR